MHEYGWTIDYVIAMTREQMVMFSKAIADRMRNEIAFQAKLHGAKMRGSGLDIDDATPVEDIMKRQMTL